MRIGVLFVYFPVFLVTNAIMMPIAWVFTKARLSMIMETSPNHYMGFSSFILVAALSQRASLNFDISVAFVLHKHILFYLFRKRDTDTALPPLYMTEIMAPRRKTPIDH